MLARFGDGEFPAVANRHEAEPDTDHAAESCGRYVAGENDADGYGGAGKRRDCVQFRGEDGGYLGDKEVACDSAADSGEDAH